MSTFQQNCNYRLLAGFVLVFCLACQSKNLDKPAVQKTSHPFKLTVANSGGFTGLTTGYTLDHKGRVQHWQHFPAQNDSILWSQETESATILAFKKQLEDLGVLKKQIQYSGNMTTQVSYVLPDTTYNWYWDQSTKTELSEWVRNVEQFCKQIQSNSEQK